MFICIPEGIFTLSSFFFYLFRIFEVCPPVLKMFKKFSDVPYEELSENENLQSHALQVMETVSLAVSLLEDTEELVSALKQIGGSHGSHDLQQAHFDVSSD